MVNGYLEGYSKILVQYYSFIYIDSNTLILIFDMFYEFYIFV